MIIVSKFFHSYRAWFLLNDKTTKQAEYNSVNQEIGPIEKALAVTLIKEISRRYIPARDASLKQHLK